MLVRLLSISTELRISYFYYQEITQSFNEKDSIAFFQLVKTMLYFFEEL
ncbi:hypothetical protein CU008_2332 [Enterococcus faecium]|nr:hypothetical protein [Enterococcus faecium]